MSTVRHLDNRHMYSEEHSIHQVFDPLHLAISKTARLVQNL